MAYLEELIHSLRNPHPTLDKRMGELKIRRRAGGDLSGPRFALFAHFRGLLGVLLVEIAPFLDPVVRRSGSLNYEPSRNVLLVARSFELKDIKLLLGIEMDTEIAGRNKLSLRVSVESPTSRQWRLTCEPPSNQ